MLMMIVRMGSMITRSTLRNLKQVEATNQPTLCAQANSASYRRQDAKWVVRVESAMGQRPYV